MYVGDYERELLKMDSHLKELRELKEKYIRFNKKYAGDPDGARAALEGIIKTYRGCGYSMFEEIAVALMEYKGAIINSFVMLERMDPLHLKRDF